ncbi:MAG: hypothetical protein C0604_08685 [Clostridiales bacterium]|nr:MAG: hypothetical protein C0604_08685 [Clostridiales bacterium]
MTAWENCLGDFMIFIPAAIRARGLNMERGCNPEISKRPVLLEKPNDFAGYKRETALLGRELTVRQKK